MGMIKTIKRVSAVALGLSAVAFCAASLLTTAVAETPKGWVDDVEAAFVQAEKEDKSLLLLFTGSDFCPPCIMMHKKVFTKDEFLKQATKDFVLVYIDFPEGDPELEKANTKYFDKYGVEGFPEVILMDPKEKGFGRFFANEYPEVNLFLARIKELKERSKLD